MGSVYALVCGNRGHKQELDPSSQRFSSGKLCLRDTAVSGDNQQRSDKLLNYLQCPGHHIARNDLAPNVSNLRNYFKIV